MTPPHRQIQRHDIVMCHHRGSPWLTKDRCYQVLSTIGDLYIRVANDAGAANTYNADWFHRVHFGPPTAILR